MDTETGQKKYLLIAERIRNSITSGTYKEGEMIPTIRELAKKYGVNPQTVNKATAHLSSLGYLRSRQGAGSEVVLPDRTKRAGIYMLIDENRSRYLEDLADPRNYHGKDIYLSYLLRMSNEGRTSRFLIYNKDDTEPRRAVEQALNEVSGFLVQGTLPEVYGKLLAESNTPTVLINRRIPQSFQGGRFASILIGLDPLGALVDYLVTLGHRKLLFVRATEFEENSVYSERLEKVRETAAVWESEFRIEVEEFVFDMTDVGTVRKLEERLKEGFTAAVGYNDGSALQFYSLLQRLGLSVRGDFSVCGFDDITAAQLATPPLTTVRVDRGRLVREAFSLIDELSRSDVSSRIVRTFETELIIRRSAFPPPK